jgi:ATP-dependent DNA helicase RecG
VLAELGLVRELGEGVDRMFSEMADHGLPAPEFRQDDATVTVTLFNTRPESEASVDHLLAPEMARPLMNLLVEHGRLTTSEAANLLGISPRTALRQFDRLREHGLAERLGTAPNDPTAVWIPRSSESPLES